MTGPKWWGQLRGHEGLEAENKEGDEKERNEVQEDDLGYIYIAHFCVLQSGFLMVCNRNALWLFYKRSDSF